MKDVDQETGRDLNPVVTVTKTEEDEKHLRNPDRPTSLLELQGNWDEDETYSRKRVQRLSSPEKWEIKQMLAASCIDRYCLKLIKYRINKVLFIIIKYN